MNLILLCHGALKEFSSFELANRQTVQYRGNYGTPLSAQAAAAVIKALKSDPYMTDKQLASSLKGYIPTAPLEGKGGFSPDVSLAGDDNLPCFIMNMANGRWWPLPGTWRSTLGRVVSDLGSPLWLNLLCCTPLKGSDLPEVGVQSDHMVKSWSEVIGD